MLAGFAALLIENMDRDFQRQVEETFRAGQPQRLAPDFLSSKESKNFTQIFLRFENHKHQTSASPEKERNVAGQLSLC